MPWYGNRLIQPGSIEDSGLVSAKIPLDCFCKRIVRQNLASDNSHPRCAGETPLIRIDRACAAGKLRSVIDAVCLDGEDAVEPRDSVGDVSWV